MEIYTPHRWEILTDLHHAYVGPGQKYGDYSAFGQITGLCPCQLQAPNATRLAGQRAV
jgi:hypothetical protein